MRLLSCGGSEDQVQEWECRRFPGTADPPCPRVLAVGNHRGMGRLIGGVLSGIQQAVSH